MNGSRERTERKIVVFRGRARDIGFCSSRITTGRLIRPIKRIKNACLTAYPTSPPPLSLVWYLNVRPRPTCLPLALLLLIFLSSCLRSLFFLLSPPRLPLLLLSASCFSSFVSPRRCHKLCDCTVRAAAPMPWTTILSFSLSAFISLSNFFLLFLW